MGDILGKLFVDPAELPNDGFGMFQVLFLGGVYGYVLFNASNMISDGSELLLLVPALAGIVGSVVLPILGAVPDGMMVLFSGLGPDAQEQLSVGVGALAGSTIMLLTIPWALAILAGRVNINENGEGNYRRPHSAGPNWSKLSPPGNMSLRQTGVVVGPEIAFNGKVMIVTSLIYLILQVPAFAKTGTVEKDKHANMKAVANEESVFALAAMLICVASFVGYLWWNVKSANMQQQRETFVETLLIEGLRKKKISLSAVLMGEIQRAKEKGDFSNEKSRLIEEEKERLKTILRPFFHQYDTDRNGKIDREEVPSLFRDLNEHLSGEALEDWYQRTDKDGSGYIDFQEFVDATMDTFVQSMKAKSSRPLGSTSKMVRLPDIPTGEADVDDEGEEEEDLPADLADLSPAEQQYRIKKRAFTLMGMGTFLVLLFSDPMVDVLSDIGRRTGISSFYISFVVAPLASNASELIAAYSYAAKKTQKTITISFSTLLGAACMNNTFCLGIFMALIYFKKLVWVFCAETLTILTIEAMMFFFALRRTHTLFEALVVFSSFFLSIMLVMVLEKFVGLD